MLGAAVVTLKVAWNPAHHPTSHPYLRLSTSLPLALLGRRAVSGRLYYSWLSHCTRVYLFGVHFPSLRLFLLWFKNDKLDGWGLNLD